VIPDGGRGGVGGRVLMSWLGMRYPDDGRYTGGCGSFLDDITYLSVYGVMH